MRDGAAAPQASKTARENAVTEGAAGRRPAQDCSALHSELLKLRVLSRGLFQGILTVVHSADLGLALSAAETWFHWRLRCAFYKFSELEL